jgi:hypothetical protein
MANEKKRPVHEVRMGPCYPKTHPTGDRVESRCGAVV